MFCPQCGAHLEAGARFCTNCGTAITGQAPQSTAYQPPPSQPPYQHASQQPWQPPQQPYQTPGRAAGYPGQIYGASAQNIPTYMAGSIIVTILSLFCCCNPISCILGIVAIVYASQVTSKQNSGDFNGAMQSSQKARSWFIAALAVMIILLLIGLGFHAATGFKYLPDFNNM